MDADMKSFLYSAHSIILFPISLLFPCKSIFGKRFYFFIPVFHTAYHNAEPPLYVNHLGKDFTQSSKIKNGF